MLNSLTSPNLVSGKVLMTVSAHDHCACEQGPRSSFQLAFSFLLLPLHGWNHSSALRRSDEGGQSCLFPSLRKGLSSSSLSTLVSGSLEKAFGQTGEIPCYSNLLRVFVFFFNRESMLNSVTCFSAHSFSLTC